MKWISGSIALVLLAFQAFAGARPDIYPFDVKIGGQLAVASNAPSEVYAKVSDPVPADAELEVPGVKEMVIINITPVKPDGTLPEGAEAKMKILMIQTGGKAKLTDTMDKSRLEPGLYGANIVAEGKTARVMFTVK